MYTAPAQAAEANFSAQWLAFAVAAVPIAPNVVTALTTVYALSHPEASWMTEAMYAWAAAAYAVIAVGIVALALHFGRRLAREGRRLLVAATVFAALVAVACAALRFAAPLPSAIRDVRDASGSLVHVAAGLAVARLCPTGFRKTIGNLSALLAGVATFACLVDIVGVRVPLTAIPELLGWIMAVVALAAVPRRV